MPSTTSLDRALSWICDNLEQFAFDLDDNVDRQITLLKPFSELILATHILKRRNIDPRLTAVLFWAWKKLDQGDYLFRLLVARPDLYQVALPAVLLGQAGFHNERLNELIRYVAGLRAFMRFEAEPWVNLSVAYSYERLLSKSLSASDFSGSWLFAKAEPWLITDNAAYAFTHEVFYLTDFGRRMNEVPADIRAYVDCWAPTWITHYQRKHDWDLVGELAIVGACLKLPWAEPAAALLEHNQNDDGSICGPPRAGRNLGRPEDSAARENFLKRYHTTLVGAIAFALVSADTQTSVASLPA